MSWSAPSQIGGSAIAAYDVRHIRSDAPNKADANWTVLQDAWSGSGTLEKDLAGLNGGTQYDVQVRAVNVAGDGPWSTTVMGTTASTISQPDAPANARYSHDGSTIVVSWDTSARAAYYVIYYDDFYESSCRLSSSGRPIYCEKLATDLMGTTYTHTSPDEDTNYYWVTACNSAGCSVIDRNSPARLEGVATAPDLVVGTPTVSESAPAAGERFTLNATGRNQGNGSSVFTTLRYYQSADSTISIRDTEVGMDSVPRLDATESSDESISLTAPAAAGTYYYGACVEAVSDESDTANNCSSAVTLTVGAAPAPDLVVDTPTVSESAPAAGGRFTLNATVRNQGNGSSVFTTLRYYQSADSTISIRDTEVGMNSVPRLDATASSDESISVTAPAAAGTYYYGACVEAVSDESDTTNNCSAAVTLTVGAAPAPDLVVDTPTVSDSAPAAGGRFTLSATVRNQGNGSSVFTTLRYYQSADSTISIRDTEVGMNSVPRLDATASSDESISVTAPAAAGTYYYGACVEAVPDESDTTNNCSAAVTLTVGAAPAPDLVVDTPTVSDSAPAVGARFTLNATVRNQGNGSSDSTTLRYYQSADSTISIRDTEVGTDTVSRLDAAESGDETISLTAPAAAGTYYYGACVEAVPDESDTTNNCSAAVTLTVGAAPAPDLVVDTPTVSESAPAVGARFTLNATVRNQGNGSSDSTTLRYYQSADSTISIRDTEVGTDTVSRLDAAESGDETISLTAPAAAGTYYYGACVDATTDESDTQNNCSASVAVTVGTSASAPGAPTGLTATADGQTEIDLSWTAPSDDGDSSITGYQIEVSEDGSNWRDLVANTGSTSTSYSHTGLTAGNTRHYRVSAINSAGTGAASNVASGTTASADVPGMPAILSVTAQAAGLSVSWSAPSQTGGSTIAAYDVRHIRSDAPNKADANWTVLQDAWSGSGTLEKDLAGLTSGTQYGVQVRAVSDAGDGPWSTTVMGTTVSTISKPDAPANPRYSHDGSTIVVSWDTSTGADYYVIYHDDFFESSCRLSSSGTPSFCEELATNINGTIYTHTSPDEDTNYYWVTACNSAGCSVIDRGSPARLEGAAPAPELEVETPTVDNIAPAAGERFTLRATVRNQGNATSDWTTLRYYQSADSTITSGDTEVGTDSVSRLDATDSSDESISLTAPAAAGTYYYGACVEAVSDESDTTNNCSAAVTLTVGAAPAPDLVVGTPTVSESAPAVGERFTLNATVRNQGNGSSVFTTLRYYQSADSTITTGDTEVGTDSVSRLDATDSSHETISLTAPAAAGTYYYGACVEAVSDESDTTNNCSAAVTLTVGAAPAPDLVVDTPTVSENAPAVGGRFTLNATVRNQGHGSSVFTTLHYYQSADSTITSGDTEVGTDSVSRLDATDSSDESISLTAPAAAGTYYYGACVEAVSDESDTTNNCSVAESVTVVSASGSDLVIESFRIPAVEFYFPTLPMYATVRNQGTGSSATTPVFFYLSTEATISTADMKIDGQYVRRLAPSETGTAQVTTTAESTPGTYYYGACVEAVSDESDTTNNCSASVAVIVGTAPPDLVVDTPTVSESAPAVGERFTLSATVRNQGNGSSDSTTLRYYQSADSTITTGDVEVGTDTVSRLDATESGGETISLTAPSADGTYYYGACVDATTDESDTQNNCSASVAVTVGTSSSAPGAPTELTATADGQTEIDLSWTAPSDDGDSSISGYQIEVSDNGSNWSDLVANTGSTSTSYSHTGLTAGSTRHYRVSAINSTGTGTVSNVANDTTEAAGTRSACATGGAVPDSANSSGLVADCDVLLAVRDTLRGTGTLNWSASTLIANWDGITVSGTPQRVTKLDTSGAGLTRKLSGTLPKELGSLTNLTTLRLSNNELTGTLPAELGSLSNLKSLSLWNNKLTGTIPPELGRLASLTLLRLHWNDLTGTIPPQLGNLENLDSLQLGGNRLTGAIPSELGRLTDLRALSLGGSESGENQLTGSIPDELRNLPKLQSLHLWNNRLSGRIPAWLGDLTDLTTLILSNNQFTGSIPAQLGNLSEVRQLWLAHNQLTGSIPAQLGSLSNVTELHLDDNRLSGTIPTQLGDLPVSKMRQLFLANNQLTGCIPANLQDVAQHDLAALGLPYCSDESAPGAPTGLTATANGQTQIDLSWTAPSNDGGATITGYKIEVSTDGASWSDLVTDTGSTTTSYSHTGLTAGSTRHYRVSAINSAGTGIASSADSATTTTAAKPGAPTGLTATANGQTQIDLSWTAPSNDGGATIAGYKIEVSTDGASWSDLVTDTGSTTTSYSHTGLTAGSTRHYRVSAINSAGTGTTSSTDSATTTAATKPGTPTGLAATANGQTQIDLTWTAPSSNGGASISGYRIEVSTDGSSWGDLVANTGSTTTSYSHTGLTAGSTRHYRVSAINSAGTGTASNTDSATTELAVGVGNCTVDLIVGPGESCTYPGTSTDFSVDSNGRGNFLYLSSGSGIQFRDITINGVEYTFVASKQTDGSWIVEEVG